MVADFIYEGGAPSALAGHDRLDVLRLADALEALGYPEEAELARDDGRKMTYGG
jgi:hypothetical protein